MRLLRCSDGEAASGELAFEVFEGDDVPPYAILSHTWAEDEVIFSHVQTGTASAHKGYAKITTAQAEASRHGLKHLWIDTCCIDKSSSAELSEAINSMFSWYRNAVVCLAHLADVQLSEGRELELDAVVHSRWFTRGWCLQELVAPSSVFFYDASWNCIGTKKSWASLISQFTGISAQVLDMTKSVHSLSIAQRMSWAAKRQTTRKEDLAYCLLGIFDVNMPLIYGEGAKAFQRLQEQILHVSDDESIFAWTDDTMKDFDEHGLLADSPANFINSDHIVPYRGWGTTTSTYMTNRGLKIDLPLVPVKGKFFVFNREGPYLAVLNCQPLRANDSNYVAILLHKLPGDSNHTYKRIHCGVLAAASERGNCETICVRQQPAPAVKDLIYPVHYFNIGRPHFARKVAILDLKSSDDLQLDLGRELSNWMPPPFSTVHKIHKQAGRLSVVILFKWLADDFEFVLILGSISDLETGFDAFKWPIGDPLPSLEQFQETCTLRSENHTIYLDETHELTVATSCYIRGDQKEYDVHMYVAEDEYTPVFLSDAENDDEDEDNSSQDNTGQEHTSQDDTAQDKSHNTPENKSRRESDCPVYSYENVYLVRPVPRRRKRTAFEEEVKSRSSSM